MRRQRKSQSFQQQYDFQPRTPNPHRQKSISKYEPYRPNNPSKPRQQQLTNKLSWSKQKKDKFELLLKQNNELRKQIVQLKINQFYHFDDKKLKDLLMQIEALKKQIKKYKENIYQLQLENQFLKRSNNHLKMELEKDIIQNKKKQNLSIDSTKCTKNTFKNEESLVQLTSFSSHFLHHLEDDYQNLKIQEKTQHRKSTNQLKKKLDKNKSPCSKTKRQISTDQQNQYLFYRRKQKIKSPNNHH